MKKWRNITVLTLVSVLLMIVYVNIRLWNLREESIPQEKITEINRMYKKALQGTSIERLKTSDIEIKVVDEKDIRLTLYMDHALERMIVLPTNEEGQFYVFAYTLTRIPIQTIWEINSFMFLCIVFLFGVFGFVYTEILRPFHRFEHIAEAMRNRDFTYELPRQRNQYFGKFVWAVDVMRKELQQHEEKEIHLMKENKVMIASISHDIKTPLSTIRLYSDALVQDLYPRQIIQQRINENCDKIDAFVKEIQNTNSEHLFDFHVQLEDVYMHDLYQILALEKERILLKKMQYTQTEFPDVLLRCDLHRFREVLGNVMDNAMKYGDGKWVRVDFYEEEHHIIMKIENSGMGVDEKDGNTIFQSFYRGNNIKHEKGNGLGLYICKQLMKKMGGDIFMTQKEGSISFHIVLEML